MSSFVSPRFTIEIGEPREHISDVHYNGIPTIQAKTALAASSGSGIMIWEPSMDTTDGGLVAPRHLRSDPPGLGRASGTV